MPNSVSDAVKLRVALTPPAGPQSVHRYTEAAVASLARAGTDRPDDWDAFVQALLVQRGGGVGNGAAWSWPESCDDTVQRAACWASACADDETRSGPARAWAVLGLALLGGAHEFLRLRESDRQRHRLALIPESLRPWAARIFQGAEPGTAAEVRAALDSLSPIVEAIGSVAQAPSVVAAPLALDGDRALPVEPEALAPSSEPLGALAALRDVPPARRLTTQEVVAALGADERMLSDCIPKGWLVSYRAALEKLSPIVDDFRCKIVGAARTPAESAPTPQNSATPRPSPRYPKGKNLRVVLRCLAAKAGDYVTDDEIKRALGQAGCKPNARVAVRTLKKTHGWPITTADASSSRKGYMLPVDVALQALEAQRCSAK